MITNVLVSAATSILSVSFQPEIRTAYLTRGRILEDRPVEANKLRVEAKLGDQASYGRIGFWHFDYSALTDRNAKTREQFLFESAYGATYHYDLRVDDAWTLSNEVMPCWITLRGYPSQTELWFLQSLRNPYVIPYWWLRRGLHNLQCSYYQVGLRKPLSLGGGFTLTPSLAVELGDDNHMYKNYAVARADARHGIRDIQSRIDLDYAVTKNLSLTASVTQYDVLDTRIRRVSKRKTPNDLAIFSIGLRLHF